MFFFTFFFYFYFLFYFRDIVFFFFFFFSSRRRHTRWNCDWSSDVCSSDLGISVGEPILPTKLGGPNGQVFVVIPSDALETNGNIKVGTPNYRAMSITEIGRASCRERV